MNFRKCKLTSYILYSVGIIPFFFGKMLYNFGFIEKSLSNILFISGAVIIFAGFVIACAWGKCPHCGRVIMRLPLKAKYCDFCRKPLYSEEEMEKMAEKEKKEEK